MYMYVNFCTCILCHLSLFLSFFLFLSLSGSGSKSATGLLEWLEIDSALDAFVMTNHQTAFSQSEYFTLANPRMLPVKDYLHLDNSAWCIIIILLQRG